MPFDAKPYDDAALVAQQELNSLIEKMTPEEKAAIEKLRLWWRRNYMMAGHKRLGRVITGKFTPGQDSRE
jgi:hypothetical protein